MLFAAGAVAIEAWIGNFGRNWVKAAVLAPLVFGGIVAAPLALPILPLDDGRGIREVLGRGPRAGGKRAERKIAPDVCRHDGLAATGGNGRRRISIALSGRSIASCDPRQKLRTGRRDRLFWAGAGPPARHQRPQQLLFVGTAAIHRRSGHRSGDAARGFETYYLARSIWPPRSTTSTRFPRKIICPSISAGSRK